MADIVTAALLGTALLILVSIWIRGYQIRPRYVFAVLLVMVVGAFACLAAGPLWFIPSVATVTVSAWVLMGTSHDRP